MKKVYIVLITILLIVIFPLSVDAAGNIEISRANKSLIIYSNNSNLGNVSRTIRTYNIENGVSYHISSNKLAPGDDKAPTSYLISPTSTPDLKQIGIIQYGKSKGYSDIAIQIALYFEAVWTDKADDDFFAFPLTIYLDGKDPIGNGINQINDSSGEVRKAFEIFFNSSEITIKKNQTGYSSAVYNFECENGTCYYPNKNSSVTVSSLKKLGIPDDAIIKSIIVDNGTTVAGNYVNVKASEATMSFTKYANQTICENCASAKISIDYDHPSNVSIPELALPNGGEGVNIINSSNMLTYKNATISTKTFTIFSGETSSLANETFHRLYACDINLIVEGGVSSPANADFKADSLQENLDDDKLAVDYSKIIGQKACNNDTYMVESSEAAPGNTFSNNRYCRIHCKEDVQIDIPSKVIAPANSNGVIFSGRYFTLQDLKIESKKTCITTMTDENGNPTNEPGINLALFYKDVYGYIWKEGDPIPSIDDLNEIRSSSGGSGGGGSGSASPIGLNTNHAVNACAAAVLKAVAAKLDSEPEHKTRTMGASEKDNASWECTGTEHCYHIPRAKDEVCSCYPYAWVDAYIKKIISFSYDYYEGTMTAGEYQDIVAEVAAEKGVSSQMCGAIANNKLNYTGISEYSGKGLNNSERDVAFDISINVLTDASVSVADGEKYNNDKTPSGSSNYSGADLVDYLLGNNSERKNIHLFLDDAIDPNALNDTIDEKTHEKIPSTNFNFINELYTKGTFSETVSGIKTGAGEVLNTSKVFLKSTKEAIEQLRECSTFFKYIDYDYKPEISFKYCDEYDIDYVMTGEVSPLIKVEYCKSTPEIIDYECPKNDKVELTLTKSGYDGMEKSQIISELAENSKSSTNLEFKDLIQNLKYYDCGDNGCNDPGDIARALISFNLGTKVEYTASWTANTVTKYYSVLPTGVARTIPIAGRSILLGTDGVVFPVNITNKKKSCEYSFEIRHLGEREFEKCFPELQNAYTCYFDIENEILKPCETCDSNGIQFFYRPISLNNVFPNSEGKASKSSYRTIGHNWNNDKGAETIKEIETENDTIYANNGDGGKGPEYSYTITPIQAYHIRAYNEEAENLNLGYADFNMTCDEYGKQCRSKWLDGQIGSCGGNVNCGQYYFTDNLTVMPDDLSTRSVYFCTWQDGTSWKGATEYETCPYIDATQEKLEASDE